MSYSDAARVFELATRLVSLDEARRKKALADIESLSAQAYRTLGVAYRRFEEHRNDLADNEGVIEESLENELVYVGVAGIIDPLRPEAAAAVADARRAGIRVIMITGDHPITATRIAADLGIVDTGTQALTGMQIDALDENNFREAVRATSVLRARCAPA